MVAKNAGRPKVYALVNAKGGVGKTTTARETGIEDAKAGSRVLLVDLDPIANLSKTLRADTEGLAGIGHLLVGNVDELEDAVQSVEVDGVALDVCVGGAVLEAAKNALVSQPDGAYALKDLLGACEGYDTVYIDTPGDLNILTVNALVAADEVVVPVLPEEEARLALPGVVDGIRRVQKRMNPALAVAGILICRQPTTAAGDPKAEVERIEGYAAAIGERVFSTRIRTSHAKDQRRNLKLIDYARFAEELLGAEREGDVG